MTGMAVILGLVAVPPVAAPSAPENPLLAPSTLPFGAPPFDRIKDGDYLPAIQAAMAQHMRAIRTIADDPQPPTFQNTFIAMERSSALLNRVLSTFYNVSSANTDPQLQHVQDVIAPLVAAHQDSIYLDPKLFARVKSVYDRLGSLHLDPESQQLVKVDYRQFVLAGAHLGTAEKTKLRKIDEQLSILRAAFDRKLLAATAAGELVLNDRSQLAGISDVAIAAASHAAQSKDKPGKWLIPLQNTTQQPLLQSLEDRAVREQLFMNGWTRAEKGDKNDTRDTIATIAKLRAEKAQLLGYPNYAAYALTDQMAKTPQAVQQFLSRLIPPTRSRAAAEAAELQATIDKDGGHFQLQPWDWAYYAEQVRKAKYGFDQNQVRPYFELDNVLKNGLFYAANRLYGITLKERYDIPVYQPDVRVYEVYDKDGSPLALMYFDFFKRDNKQGGAWMSTFVDESKLLGTKPVVYNVLNFTKPAPGQPALLTPENVTGMFHEFGHALNAFFADQEYASLAGTNTARDFVEYPSQFNEHWALYPAILKHYAVNYKTGQRMPQALMEKIVRASKFNQGYALGEVLAADELDMAWHTLPASAPKQNVDAFEKQALISSGTNFAAIPPRYRSTYFAHIWSSGYAAGYYAYNWSEMLDDDTYQWFVKHGGLTRANGERFRAMILSRGHSQDYGTMFRAFYGKDPDVGPLLQYRGLQ
jgi:peptidyl-dipeptidase Dcp